MSTNKPARHSHPPDYSTIDYASKPSIKKHRTFPLCLACVIICWLYRDLAVLITLPPSGRVIDITPNAPPSDESPFADNSECASRRRMPSRIRSRQLERYENPERAPRQVRYPRKEGTRASDENGGATGLQFSCPLSAVVRPIKQPVYATGAVVREFAVLRYPLVSQCRG